ncbi:cilia- and flagella-associated protein 45-like [Selaginella moellendorffii]|uniref:cilia- and flagella-associated protein 45-like n=1 Tax=Selaginella moellendorffii TaxID=88036 RepID=UPI000D1CDC84|nr:cilia- and flagella-associated protein 45-like [Selaginella moellendorffii]|eukprot:XP_024543811.1 cilia- and flagella-associated protein 45-like [Selaginella moellendorffii]
MAKIVREQKAHDDHEARRHHQRMEGAAVIRHQIKEREGHRKIEDELKQLEGIRIRRQAEKDKLEEEEKAKVKHEEGQKLYKALLEANAANTEQRKLMKMLEKEEEQKIQLYNYKKAVAEQERADEAERIRKQKELETARLRSMQEKAQGQQAALDELRAQRIQEAVEREWREKEKAAAERLRKMNEDLAEAREQQKMFKITQLAEQAKQERIEFFKIIKDQQEALLKAKILAEEQHKRNLHHRDDIMGQIAKNREVRLKAIKEKFEEGARARLKLLAEFERLRLIKERKLKELEAEGVPDKYRAELARKKVVIN